MKTELIRSLPQNFESASHKADDVEYWLARELQELLNADQTSPHFQREGLGESSKLHQQQKSISSTARTSSSAITTVRRRNNRLTAARLARPSDF